MQGENFSPNSIVILGGVHLDTKFVGDGELNARVPSEETARVGNYQMGVFTPRPGGGTTAGMTFVIEYK